MTAEALNLRVMEGGMMGEKTGAKSGAKSLRKPAQNRSKIETESVPPLDTRPHFWLAIDMPENIKIAGLSDAAFRWLVTLLAYCARTKSDGLVPLVTWRTVPTRIRRELTRPPQLAPSRAPLMCEVEGGAIVHDYLKHNKSRDEISELATFNKERGAYGSHKRWHADRGKPVEECEYCQGKPAPRPPQGRFGQ